MSRINTKVDMDVTTEEADNIVALVKKDMADPTYHGFDDDEQERFFKLVNLIHITRGDDAYLQGSTFFVGCDISRAKLENEFKKIIYFDYDKMFPKEKEEKKKGGSFIKWIIIIVVLIIIIRSCTGC